jgi:hypothetical protein
VKPTHETSDATGMPWTRCNQCGEPEHGSIPCNLVSRRIAAGGPAASGASKSEAKRQLTQRGGSPRLVDEGVMNAPPSGASVAGPVVWRKVYNDGGKVPHSAWFDCDFPTDLDIARYAAIGYTVEYAYASPPEGATAAEMARLRDALTKIRKCCDQNMSRQEALIVRWCDAALSESGEGRGRG